MSLAYNIFHLQVIGPRLIHGLFAALTDIWVCSLARKVLNDAFVQPTVSSPRYLEVIFDSNSFLVYFIADIFFPCAVLVKVDVKFVRDVFDHDRIEPFSMGHDNTRATFIVISQLLTASTKSQLVLASRASFRRCIIFAALVCAIRPTNAIIWLYMLAVLTLRLRAHPRYLVPFFRDTAFVGFVMLSCFAARCEVLFLCFYQHHRLDACLDAGHLILR